MEKPAKTRAETTIVEGVVDTLYDHNGKNVVAIDIHEQSSWTDYFVIATVDSAAHMKGLKKYLKEYLDQYDIDILHSHKKMSDETWLLVDCGFLIIHLMGREAREFYDLEKLWFKGKQLFRKE